MAITTIPVAEFVHGPIQAGDSFPLLNNIKDISGLEWGQVFPIRFSQRLYDNLASGEFVTIRALKYENISQNYYVVFEGEPYTFPIQVIYPHIFEGNKLITQRVNQFDTYKRVSSDRIISNGLFAMKKINNLLNKTK